MKEAIKSVIFFVLFLFSATAWADSFDDPIDINIGEINHQSIIVDGDTDYFRFTVEATATYYIFSRGGLSLEGTLFDIHRNVISREIRNGENHNFRIVNPLVPGTYILEVKGRGVNVVGDYDLHIEGPGQGTISDIGGYSFWSAGSANIGETKNAQINADGDIDYFKFTVESEALYYIFSQGQTDIQAHLYQDFVRVASSERIAVQAHGFMIQRTLSPGEYYLEISSRTRRSELRRDTVIVGGYSLHIEGPDQTAGLDAEGSTHYSATTANPGEITSANLAGVDDIDYFKITIENDGEYFIFCNGERILGETLFDASLTRVRERYFEDTGFEQNVIMGQYALTAGVYYLKIIHNLTSNAILPFASDYTIHIEGEGKPTATDADGNTPFSASSVSFGEIKTSTLDKSGDRDLFKFTVTEANRYFFFSSGPPPAAERHNLEVRLYDENIRRLSIAGFAASFHNRNNFRVEADLTPGDYYLMISGNPSPRNYNIHFEGPGNPTNSDNASPWSATPFLIGGIEEDSLDNTPTDIHADIDYFTFGVANRGRYFLFSTGTTNIKGSLFDSFLEELESDVSDGEESNFLIERMLEPGTYYLRVEGPARTVAVNGEYAVHLEGPPNKGTQSDDHGFSPYSATNVTVPVQIDGAIDQRGDKDYFAFRVFNQGMVRVSTEGDTDTKGTLLNYNLETVDTDSSAGSGRNFSISANLPAGIYYVRVAGQLDRTRGEYSLFIGGEVGPVLGMDQGIDLTYLMLLLLLE